ncbi:hypothetical protein LVJ94_50440 [Pendulispora rubella]|uniref:Cell surface protein n=1 Tax=Pendulispora rubella TaxID=2741070 RepID=A0ABZ2L2X8_9BACT
MRALSIWLSIVAASTTCVFAACGSDDTVAIPPPDSGTDARTSDTGTGTDSGSDTGTDSGADTGTDSGSDASFDAGPTDGGPSSRFVTRVVSFNPGPCAGYGADKMPGEVMGPPRGGGDGQGGLEVVSLGVKGEIVLAFEPNAIVDGPGTDFLVFENPFNVAGNPQNPYAEPAEVSVSDDGTNWKTYPCTATAYPYGPCAGWHPVYSTPDNGISPTDPSKAGGDPFDLAAVGLSHAKYVRIVDKSTQACSGGAIAAGFDLDAVSIVNAEIP